MSRRPGRAELLLLGASLLALGLGLWAAELAFRAWAPPAELLGHALADLHVYSERYGWEPRPRFRGRVAGARVTINARGYRGRLHPARPGPGRPRWLLLGDSVTFGYRVHDEQTFAHLLEADGRAEALNLAVEGWGTGQQVLRLEHELARARATGVLLNLCLENDVVDNWLGAHLYDGRSPQPYFRLEQGQLVLHDAHLRLPAWRRPALWLERRSLLFARLARAPAPPPPPGAGARWRVAKEQVLRDPRPALELTFALLRRADQLCRAAGARLLVVLHPNKRALQGRASLREALLSAPELDGIERLDLAQSYLERRLTPAELFLDGSGHLTPRGHELVAELLRERLRR